MRAKTAHKHIRANAFKRMYRHEALCKQRGRCCFCKDKVSHAKVTAEHTMPRARGGLTVRENIRASCAPCNVAKGKMSDSLFRQIIKGHEMPFPVGPLTMAWVRYRINNCVLKAERRIYRAVGVSV